MARGLPPLPELFKRFETGEIELPSLPDRSPDCSWARPGKSRQSKPCIVEVVGYSMFDQRARIRGCSMRRISRATSDDDSEILVIYVDLLEQEMRDLKALRKRVAEAEKRAVPQLHRPVLMH